MIGQFLRYSLSHCEAFIIKTGNWLNDFFLPLQVQIDPDFLVSRYCQNQEKDDLLCLVWNLEKSFYWGSENCSSQWWRWNSKEQCWGWVDKCSSFLNWPITKRNHEKKAFFVLQKCSINPIFRIDSKASKMIKKRAQFFVKKMINFNLIFKSIQS